MYAPFKSNNISIHSAGVVECCSERVLFLHILPLGVHTALWSGATMISCMHTNQNVPLLNFFISVCVLNIHLSIVSV